MVHRLVRQHRQGSTTRPHPPPNCLVPLSLLPRIFLFLCRFVITSRGLGAMADKYANAAFGKCPRVLCSGQPCLPVGRSDLPRNFTVNVYCPMCQVRARHQERE